MATVKKSGKTGKTPARPAAKSKPKPAEKKPVTHTTAKKAVVKKPAVPATKSSKPAVKSAAKTVKAPAPPNGKAPAKPKSASAPQKSQSQVKSADKKPVKPQVPVKSSGKEPIKEPVKNKVAAKPAEISKPAPSKSGKPQTPVTASKSPVKPPSTSKGSATPQKSGSGKEGQMDPMDKKAEKIMKELSETMDLSKVKPRIQAGSPPAKALSKHAQNAIKLVEPTNTTKVKFQLEFEFRASPKILFNYLSDSSGLAGWFADEVRTKDNVYSFVWEGSESNAKLVAIKDMQLVRFQWMEETDGTYWQFEIKEDDITSDVALIITDFAQAGEKETNIRLWESQVQNLRLLLGSF